MFGFGGFGFGTGAGRFEAHYRCYPVTFIDKPEAERGDKIFMPPSALDRLGTFAQKYHNHCYASPIVDDLRYKYVMCICSPASY